MALVCIEHGHDPVVGEDIYIVVLVGTGRNFVLCERGFSSIPSSDYSADEVPGGASIYAATSKRNGAYSESYSWSDLQRGHRLFSISQESLIRHLPEMAARFASGEG